MSGFWGMFRTYYLFLLMADLSDFVQSAESFAFCRL